ncbi:MAG: response regulator [Candidatus Adiutrix sp.]|jgi:DNA-binding response OmpR family regulator|nr:response regulator [Candidatus Adiutrix sp.]
MPKILVSLSDADMRESAVRALSESRHKVIVAEDIDLDRGLSEAAEKIRAYHGDVIVMDYRDEDAASVKLMQTVDDFAEPLEFIFIESSSAATARDQVLMALNEGARAFLPRDFNPSALLNYVERAISGPGRLRSKAQEPYGTEVALKRMEESFGDLRVKTVGYQKLISHLLATPVGAQARKVLVVSDSPYQLELLKKFLEDHNFNVLTASNMAGALSVVLSEGPRTIVSDLELEDQTGLDLCQAVKFAHKITPCYFIICTANRDKISKVMTPGNGVDDCLIKPSGQNDRVDFISRVALGLLL